MTTSPCDPEVFAIFRTLRLQRNLSQEELADLAGLSVRAVRNIESGRVACPRLSTVRRLAGALAADEATLGSLEAASAAARRLPGRPEPVYVLVVVSGPGEPAAEVVGRHPPD